MFRICLLLLICLTAYCDTHRQINLISVLGGPGSGKGTQCAMLAEKFGFKHVSTGDLFRQHLKNNGPYSTLIRQYVDSGRFVPSEIGVKLFVSELQKLKNGETVLLDGFPRNRENIEAWDQVNKGNFRLNTFLYLDCPLGVMQSRLIQRGKISGRSDDNRQTIRKRLQLFLDQTQQVIDSVQSCSQCKFIKIDADNSVEEVWKQVQAKFIELGYQPRPTIDIQL